MGALEYRCSSIRGAGVIELLCAMGLVAVILSMSTPLLKLTTYSYLFVSNKERARNIYSTTKQVISQGVKNSTRLHAIAGLRVQPRGKIVDVSKRDVLRGRYASSILPDGKSIALSFLELQPEKMFRVLRVAANEKRANITMLCLFGDVDSKTEGIAEINNWLGVSIDGVGEYSGKVRLSRSGRSSCPYGRVFVAKFGPTKGAMFFKGGFGGDSELGRVQLFIPVEASYSIYLARNGELRRLSHISTENQPIVGGLEQLEISSEHESGVSSYYIRLRYAERKMSHRTFSVYVSNVEAHHPIDLIL